MGTERLPMRKIREVLRLRYEKGLSQRAVAAACVRGVTIIDGPGVTVIDGRRP